MIILRIAKGRGRGGPYRSRLHCQLFQLAFLTSARELPEGVLNSDVFWYCHNALDFCFTAEQFRILINPLLNDWAKRQEKIDELLSNPFLAEQFAIYSKTPRKTFLEAIKEWYDFVGLPSYGETFL